ncbi:MAG: GIY-YIG nuclease family protein [Verrucomicrobiales bacterium]|nr:GIY-YIG nuclease family protein [Verrucomicrobiales bacterium]MCP5518888.1 GIY-YIG nuclease family protein [Verrucomicrobiales bacterium]MCP5518889.1 GIY-YIG nuclease family protein [Verrucomicrobiales bacterium]MCP5518890.1 GIY-YIG nuclease family protein [Verrucomicrobiales bacterium]
MAAWAYVLRSSSGRHYYGSTTDLERRLEQHSRGHTATTAKDAPWVLVASVACESLVEARQLERRFKRWKSPGKVLEWCERAEGAAVEQPRPRSGLVGGSNPSSGTTPK